MFEELTASIQEDTVKYLLKIEVEKVNREQRKPQPQNYVEQGGSLSAEQRTVVRKTEPGRNDPCPCGSGKKYKNCCGRQK